LPNIVFILADDLGVGSVNCYHAGTNLVRTPNMDRLAREGRRFTDANTPSSVCSPTRYAVLTGRYCWRTPLKHEVLGVGDPLWIETNRLTVASLVKRHGYATAAIGKWHLGYGPSKPVNYTGTLRPGPQEVGFDYHFGVPSNHGDLTGIFVDNERVMGLRSTNLAPFGKGYYGGKPFFGLDAPQRDDESVMDTLTGKVVAWLENQDRAKPFFLYFTPVAVHEPATPSARMKGTSVCGAYGDWIHELDLSVGRILDALDRLKLAENTLVIFTSDNGGVLINDSGTRPEARAYDAGMRVSGPWRGRKHSIYEGGFRVPFLARWPGHIPAGTVCDETINLVDTLATTAAILGAKLPAANAGAEDSFNVLPALLGEKIQKPLRPAMIVHSADGVFAIRQGPWKWIEGESSKPQPPKARAAEFQPQLYNLKNDPAEATDVSAKHPEVVKELAALLDRYRDGGYSRELPSVLTKTASAIAMPVAATNVVLTEPLDKVPAAPWVVVRGKWVARDGAVWASQRAGEQGPAALRSPLAQTDGDIQYDLNLPSSGTHTLRVQCATREHVLLVEVSRTKVSVSEQSSGRQLGEVRARLRAGEWVPMRVCFRGPDLFVEVGETGLKVSDAVIGEAKSAFALLGYGEAVGFRRVAVRKTSE
jgi:arylsulfatase A-like enzyme